jgi:hypothetical protein
MPLQELVKDVLLEVKQDMWFPQNGAPGKSVRCVQQFLNQQFEGH